MNLTERELKVVELIQQNNITNFIEEYSDELLNLNKGGIIAYNSRNLENGDMFISNIKINKNLSNLK